MQRGGLSRAGLADDAQRPALRHVEADAVDRADLADLPAEDHAFGQPVGLRQVANPNDDVGSGIVVNVRGIGRDAVNLRRAAPGHLITAEARRRMVRGDHGQGGLGPAALIDGQRTPWRERASRWQHHQRRRRTGYRHQPFAAGGTQARHRTQQPCGVGHPAIGVQALDAGLFNRAAGVHHQRPVGELGHHTQVVSDDQDASAGHIACGLEDLEDLRLHRDIECSGRLVADDQVRVIGDRDGDHHPLALAAGKFMREGSRPG